MQDILLIPILKLILILIHLINEPLEHFMLLLSIRGRRLERYRFGSRRRRSIHILLRIEYDCCSGEGTYIRSKHLIIRLFLQYLRSLTNMRLSTSPIVVSLIEGKVCFTTVLLLQFVVLIIEMKVHIYFLEIGLLLHLQLCFKLLLEAHLGHVLEIELRLLHLKDPFGMDHLILSLHQLAQQRVLRWDPFLEEILEILFVLLDIVASQLRGGRL